MVASAKAAVPTVTDQAAAMQLSQCAKNLATSLAELRTASQKVGRSPAPRPSESCGVARAPQDSFPISPLHWRSFVLW